MWTKYLSHVGNHLGEKRKALPPARKIACVNWFNSRKGWYKRTKLSGWHRDCFINKEGTYVRHDRF